MISADIRRKYIEFFKKRRHVEIPSAKLVPENDPTTLSTSSGMQPLVPYLLGQKHPEGKRLVNSQKSFRSQDIEEVGNNRHTTFFEMLGNWSLGDYFKKEQLEFFWTFLTHKNEGLGLSKEKLFVSIFEGNNDVPRDAESYQRWLELGVAKDHIFEYGVEKNWWSRSGVPEKMPAGEPGGPDSEVFFDFGDSLKLHENSQFKNEKCHPNCDCGRFMEIGNSVFMQYKKLANGNLEELAQKNVDFGGGLERLAAAVNDEPDVFKTDFFFALREKLLKQIQLNVNDVRIQRVRIFMDHSRAVIFLSSEGIFPGKNDREYVLRRLIRRADDQLTLLGLENEFFWKEAVFHFKKIYKGVYSDEWDSNNILAVIINELRLYGTVFKNVEKEKKELEQIKLTIPTISQASISAGPVVFKYQSTFGIPYSVSEKLVNEIGLISEKVSESYEEEMEKHRNLSRTTSTGMFKGGLADQSVETTKLHTAHHLLLAALQKIVDSSIKQRGSNITAERLRIDFSFDRKLTQEEIKKIEDLVNQKIAERLPVTRIGMKKEDAKKLGAQMEFGAKYPDMVSVYFVGLNQHMRPEQATSADYFSAEFCGGPHVSNTSEIGESGKKFKIQKEESVGSGVRRIKGVLT